jgi:hypothetical protein
MVAWIGSGGAIRENKAFVPTIICFSHGRMDVNVCGDVAEDDVPDASSLKEHIEIGPIERTFARLIDNAFSSQRSKVGNDLPAGFGTGRNFARRARDNSSIGSDLCLSYQTRVYARCPKEAEVCRSLPSTDVRRRKRHGVLPKATNESLGPVLLGACFGAGGGTDTI